MLKHMKIKSPSVAGLGGLLVVDLWPDRQVGSRHVSSFPRFLPNLSQNESHNAVSSDFVLDLTCKPYTHRPLSSSFLGLHCRILNMNHKKELLRGLWVVPNFSAFRRALGESDGGQGGLGSGGPV